MFIKLVVTEDAMNPTINRELRQQVPHHPSRIIIFCEFTADERRTMTAGDGLLHFSTDIEGQTKIIQSKIIIIGAGGLSAPAALYLAAAGAGTIGIADGLAEAIIIPSRQP